MLPPFQRLVDDHWRDVARLCAALAGAGAGEDAAQRAWLRALEAYPKLRHGSNLRAWLMTIAWRSAVDEHRDRRRRPEPVEQVPERTTTPEEMSTGYDVWAVARKLPERQRAALALRYVLDMPHSEVAEILGITPTASRRLVSDALATLRPELTREEEA